MAWEGSTRRERLPATWASLRRYVLNRDGHRCQLQYDCCVQVATDVDHMQASTDDHDPARLQAACAPCHRRKSSGEGGTSAGARRRAMTQRVAEPHPAYRPMAD